MTIKMFENFTRHNIKTHETTINLVLGGSGRPVLLLHGYPENYFSWHKVAPILAEKFTVICADLRGFGDSGKPASDSEHFAYSKRVLAQDQIETMQKLGFEKFAVVGHDRGARVAHRMALDHGNHIEKLALLDIIPTKVAFEMTDQKIATDAFNWFFSIQEGGLPERLIEAESAFYLNWCLDSWVGSKNVIDPRAVAEYVRCFDREMIRATNEEFRAAASIDLVHDAADSEKKIACPVLVLWSAIGMWAKYDILKTWRERCAGYLYGEALNCGHFLPEEAPDETARKLTDFLSST
jgi:haloacetate dehalogenase